MAAAAAASTSDIDSESGLHDLLRSTGDDDHADIFIRNSITSVDDVRLLQESDWTQLGVPIGVRNRLKRTLSERQGLSSDSSALLLPPARALPKNTRRSSRFSEESIGRRSTTFAILRDGRQELIEANPYKQMDEASDPRELPMRRTLAALRQNARLKSFVGFFTFYTSYVTLSTVRIWTGGTAAPLPAAACKCS